MRRLLLTTCASLAMLGAASAEPLKVGMMLTLSGPAATLGQHVLDGFNLALADKSGKLGGQETEVVVVDDELKPDVAVTRVEGLLQRDEVDFVVGTIFSNMLQAIFKPVVESETFLISPNAGPSTFAGRNCNPYFFVVSYQNNQVYEALGEYANENGLKRVFMMAPNYQAGRDSFEGFKQTYKGEVVGEVFTPLGANDFSAEIAQISTAEADALFTFMPGGMGVRLVKQFTAAGLADQMKFLSAFTVDEATLPAIQGDGVGLFNAGNWAPDTDLPQSRAFVDAFLAKYGYLPGGFAMQGYDAALLIDSAVSAVGGDLSDKDAVREALEAADFESLRGKFAFNTNHYPIQNFYVMRVGERDDGLFQTEIEQEVFADYSDSYAGECKM